MTFNIGRTTLGTASASAPAFNPETWKKSFASQVAAATRADGSIDAAAVPAMAELQHVLPPDRMDLVYSALEPDKLKAFVAARMGRSVDAVAPKLLQLLRVVVDEPIYGANHVFNVDAKPLIEGATTVELVGADITQIAGADVICVPGHRSKPEKGGGARGGIELGLLNRAHQLGDSGMAQAIETFERERGDQVLPPGATIAVPLPLESRGHTAGAFLMGASVPPPLVRSNEKLGREHLAQVLRAYLDAALASGLAAADRSPSTANPPTIVLAAMCTGGDAAVTPETAGAVYKEVLAAWAVQNPGVRVIVAINDEGTRSRFETGFQTGAERKLSVTPDITLNKLTQGLGVATAGITLNRSFINNILTSSLASLQQDLPKMVSDEPYSFVSQIANNHTQEAAWQLHRLISTPAMCQALGGPPLEVARDTLMKVLSGEVTTSEPTLQGLREAIVAEIANHREFKDIMNQPNQFGHADKLAEVMQVATAKVLRERRFLAYEAAVTEHATQVSTLEKKLADALQQVATVDPSLAAEVGVLRAKLTRALASQEEANQLRIELGQILAKNSNLSSQISSLQDQLSAAQRTTSTYQSRVSSYSSSS